MSASRPRPPPRRGDGSRHSKTSQATSSSTSTSLQVPSSSSAASYGPDLRTERASKGKERESGFFVELPGGSISSRPRFSSPRKQGPKSSEDEKHEQARVDGSCADEGTIDAEVERMAQLAVMTGASADAHVGQASRSNPPPARSFKGKRASRMTDPDAQTINSTVRQSPPRSASNLQSTRSRPQPPPGRFARTHKASGTDQAGAAGPSSSSTASEAETIRMDVEQSGAESSTTSGPQSARRAARTPIRSQTAAQKDANFIDAGDHLVGSTSEANSEAMEIDGELGAAREQSPSRAPRPAPRPVRATHKMRREPRIAVKRADWPDEKRLACVRLNGSPDPGSLAVSSFGCVAITTPKVIHIITPSLTFSTAQKPNLTLFSPGTMEDLSGELSSAFYSSIEVSCVVQMMRLRAKFEDGMDARNAFTHDYMLGHPGSGLPVWRKAAWCPALLGDQGGPVLAIQTAMMDLYLFQPKPGAFPGSMVYKERLEAPATKVQFERRKRQVMLNEQISDMAWLDFAPEAVASTCAYLVGSSRSGKLYVWRCHQSAPSDFMLQANVADFPIDYVVASKCKTNSDGARSAIVATFYSGTLDFLNVALDPAGQISIERVTNAARPLNVGISVPTWLDDDYLYFGTPGAIMRYTPGAAAEMETALLGEREDDQPGEAMSTCIRRR
ncbi:hypothetical protein IE81DRAFT_236441 [Ceraceosorus guamensis]|uniref:Uncharacterized protein n=1 Tax=Ceraceosorus guamensis TaxID=1522189 RepID=A0A316VRH8_9BASI|nr:hypothetical protein IE81DRAFT_236441 [Ceraceosorus guamensis]PWN40206.1 hypothetical protein IE81DRAFT_236441 [Ceraceosorus guamensis]